jgi:hypothetical protein
LRISARVVILVLFALTTAVAAESAETESLLLPGIDMRSVEFKVGAWCRYQVIDEALGEADTSTVYLAVVGREKTATGVAYWLEVENSVRGAPRSERDVARALVDERIRTLSEGDSLYHYISRFYTVRGDGPVEPGDPKVLRRLTMVSPASQQDWKTQPDQRVETPAGKFVCEHRNFENSESRDIPSGSVVVKQKKSDRVDVWISPAVPLFHLVKSEIARSRESRTVPAVRGIPQSGPRTSRTTSILVAHGTGAKPLVPIP